jgi:hypothetical protein
MITVPAPHKKLFATAGLIVVIGAVAAWAILKPMANQVDALEGANDTLRKKLAGTGFPLSPQRLTPISADLKQRNAEVHREFSRVYDVSTREFADQIKLYSTVQGFQKSITVLDYQEKYLSVKRDLKEKKIYLDDDYLGLTEASSSPKNYQLYSQLMLVHSVASLAKDNNLELGGYDFMKREGDEPNFDIDPDHPPARVTVLPVITYVTERDPSPFAEEYQIQMTVTGHVHDFSNFLLELTRGKHFAPVKQVTVQKTKGEKPDYSEDLVIGTIVCCAYLQLKEKADTAPPEVKNQISYQPGA